jgi:uncharacterized protein (DUF362 family)
MKTYSRRQLIKYLSAGAGIASVQHLLSACNRTIPIGETPGPASIDSPIPDIESPTGQLETSATPASYPDLVVARNGEPEDMVRRAIAAIGGMGRFVHAGSTVVVKPNACVAYHSYEYAATTNPWVVAALVKMAYEAGAGTVKVFDYPFGGSFQNAFSVSGIGEQVLAAGAILEPMQTIKFIETEIPNALNLKKTRIYEDVLSADVLINVPIAKNHGLAKLTLGMKNLMGTVLERERLHRDLGECLTDLNSRVRSTLTVIDAVRILTANGPTGGNLDDVQQTNTIIASTDVVTADSYAAQTLFNISPDQLSYVSEATTRGLGRSDLNNLKIEEIQVGG